MDFSDGGPRRGGTPKFSEILRRPRGEAEITIDSPDLDFVYNDADSYEAEMAELYSYSEEPEFFVNKKYFDETADGLSEFFHVHYKCQFFSSLHQSNFMTHFIYLSRQVTVSR